MGGKALVPKRKGKFNFASSSVLAHIASANKNLGSRILEARDYSMLHSPPSSTSQGFNRVKVYCRLIATDL